ncbi:MAG: PQQ-binding-like beta-propeller repeat protein [Dehalococcoidia bacterium]|nr:PQQ-binding-like beta-propeller repeat protein [Dehalococcoidia bacterium]
MHRRLRSRFLFAIVSAGALLAAAILIGAGGITSAQQGSGTATPPSGSASTPGAGATSTGGAQAAAGVPPEVSQNANQWPLANSDYANTRAANGSTINSSDVGRLGVAWTFKIPGSAQFGNAASNPIISGGTVYLQDLASNVYAFDLQSGKMKWKKDYNQPASGPNGPGVAYGKVFVPLNDGSVVALDATNGNQLWQTKLSRSDSEGITIQLTPYDNTVWVSTVPGTGQSFYKGGDTGVLYGLNQQTGEILWNFDTVESPNRWGNPNVNSGGGAWYPPAIDATSGRSFWGIGNPAPFPGTREFPNGSSRPGPNLYTDSMISLAPQPSSGSQPAGTPSASGTQASGSTTPSASGTQGSGSTTPSVSGTQGSGSTTPSASGTQASGSTTPSASGTGTPSTSGPGVPGNATVAPATGTAPAGSPTAAATPPSPNCNAPAVEGGGGQPPQGSSNSNTANVPLKGTPAQLAWYHQVKAHDLFDLDFEASPILATSSAQGKQRDIVIGAGKLGYVVAFDRNTGDVVWKVAVGQHMNDNLQTLPQNQSVQVLPGPLGGVETPMAYANGVVYVPVNNLAAFYTACGLDVSKFDFSGGTGELVAIDVNTGQYLWDKQLPSANYGAATVVNDIVFTTTFDGTLYGFNAKTGEQVYRAQLPAGINGWPAVSGDTIIFPAGVGATPSLVALRVGAGNSLPTPAAKATGTTTPGTPAASRTGTPAANGTASPAASGTPSPRASGTASGTTTGATLTVTGQNIAFDTTTLTASAGTVKVTFVNKDSGIPHNIHFFKGSDANGQSVAATPIKPGPATDTLTMNLQPGTYSYQCDVHPLQMKGTLTVK